MALSLLGTIILFTWSTLFLIGGIVYALAGMLGYIVTTRRIPWRTIS